MVCDLQALRVIEGVADLIDELMSSDGKYHFMRSNQSWSNLCDLLCFS